MGCVEVTVPGPRMWDVFGFVWLMPGMWAIGSCLFVLGKLVAFACLGCGKRFRSLCCLLLWCSEACARVVGCWFLFVNLFIMWFLFRGDALSLIFRGGAVRFSVFPGGLWLLVLCLVFWAVPFW